MFISCRILTIKICTGVMLDVGVKLKPLVVHESVERLTKKLLETRNK